VDVELVQLPVSVVDSKGLPVRNLQQAHFSVYEDKVLQNISLFKQEDIPLSVALVVDASSSMLDKVDRLNAAAMTFLRESNPEDETALVSFGDDVFIEQDFTDNTRELSDALAAVHLQESTAFYDAVYLAAQHLQDRGARDKKVLLVITDGEDNKSKYTLKQVAKAVAESKVIVYSVGLLSSSYSTYGVDNDKAQKALKQLAEMSGGAYFFPKNMADVEQICARIAHDLRNQYTIGYRPSNRNLDGAWRKIAVRVDPPEKMPKLKVRTKQGYYAPVAKRETALDIPH
jgi:VWFA-related protein